VWQRAGVKTSMIRKALEVLRSALSHAVALGGRLVARHHLAEHGPDFGVCSPDVNLIRDPAGAAAVGAGGDGVEPPTELAEARAQRLGLRPEPRRRRRGGASASATAGRGPAEDARGREDLRWEPVAGSLAARRGVAGPRVPTRVVARVARLGLQDRIYQ